MKCGSRAQREPVLLKRPLTDKTSNCGVVLGWKVVMLWSCSACAVNITHGKPYQRNHRQIQNTYYRLFGFVNACVCDARPASVPATLRCFLVLSLCVEALSPHGFGLRIVHAMQPHDRCADGVRCPTFALLRFAKTISFSEAWLNRKRLPDKRYASKELFSASNQKRSDPKSKMTDAALCA